MLVVQIVVMCLPMLKLLLIKLLALVLFLESHMLVQITSMSDLEEALMTWGGMLGWYYQISRPFLLPLQSDCE